MDMEGTGGEKFEGMHDKGTRTLRHLAGKAVKAGLGHLNHSRTLLTVAEQSARRSLCSPSIIYASKIISPRCVKAIAGFGSMQVVI